MAKSNKRVKKQAEQLTKVVLAFALLSPHALTCEIGSTVVMAEAVETISVVSDTASMKAVQSSKVKVEMNSDGKYRIVLLPNTNVFYGGDTGNVSTIIDHNGTAINFKSLPLNYYRVQNNVIEMSRQKDNVEYILRVSIVNATSQGGYMKVELEAVNRSGSTMNLGGTFYWDTMVNGNDASPFEVIENGWRNYSGGVQVTAFYANTYNVVDADRIFMGQYSSPDSARLTGGQHPSTFVSGQTVTASDTAAQFWWEGKAVANQSSRKFSTIVGIGPKNAPPSFALTAPSTGQTYYKGEQLQIVGTTRDTDVGDLLTVKWSIDGGEENTLTQIRATGANQSFNTTYTLPNTLSDGTHTLQVWVMDDKGGVSSAGTVHFTVRSFVVPGTPTFNSINNNSLLASWDKKTNDSSVTYELKNITTNQSYDTGSLHSRQITGLTPNTNYSFAVRAKNLSGTYTGFSSPTNVYTHANIPADANVVQSGNSVTASWSANGNPAGTKYKTEIRTSSGQVLATGETTNIRADLALTGLADGEYEVFVAAVNGAGIQTAFQSAGQIMKDTTGPTAPTIVIDPSSWTKDDVRITITPGSDTLSGIMKTQVKVGLEEDWRDYDEPFRVSFEGKSVITSRSIDTFGNIGQESSVWARVDRTAPTPPVISLNPPGWTKSGVTVTLTEGRDEASGIAVTEYRLGSEGAWIAYDEPFTIDIEGITEVQARSVDHAANISSLSSSNVRIDKTGPEEPEIDLSDEGWTNHDVTIVITGGEDHGSGLIKTQYRLNEQGPWIDYVGEVMVSHEGETTIYARSLDLVGNVSRVANATIRIDKTAPTEPTITLAQTGWSKNPVEFTLGGSIDKQDITYEYSLDEETFIAGDRGVISTNGMTTLRARAIDAVGNIGKVSTREVYIDQVAPTVTFSPNGHQWTDNDITTTIRFEDADSGIDESKRLYKITGSDTPPEDWIEALSDEQTVQLASEGVWYIHVRATDYAGNTYQTVSAPYQIQRKPEQPGRVRAVQVGETSAELMIDLPTGDSYTDGYQYHILNKTTGQSWTLDYPSHTLIDTGLSGGHTYEYEVVSRNHTGISETVSLQVLTLPAAPQSVHIRKVESQPDMAELYFEPVDGATAYRVTAESLEGQLVYDESVSDPTHVSYLTNLIPGTVHTITVTASNGSGAGRSSGVGFLTLPGIPGELSAVQIREHEISLSWDNVLSATAYLLSREGMNVYEGIETEYEDKGLESGTAYSYELVAENETGLGPAATTRTLMTLPDAVTALRISDPTTTSLRLSWDGVRGADQYAILVNGVKQDTIPSGTEEWVVTGLVAGTEYELKVQAVNISGQGVSTFVTGMTRPEVPSGLSADQLTETGAVVSWNAVSGATKYRVTIDGQSYEISDTRLTLRHLQASKHYTYQVEAGNAAGYGADAVGELLTLPSRPGGLSVIRTNETSIAMKWDSVDTANNYIVSVDGAEVGRTSEPEYTAANLLPGMEYVLEVQAVNESGLGESAQLIHLSQPTQPDELVIKPEAHQAEVIWSAVKGASVYVIEGEGQEIYRGRDTRVIIPGLVEGTQYTYTLRALNRQGTSSEVVDVPILTLPAQPLEIKTFDVNTTGLHLDWTTSGVRGADGYILERDGQVIAQIESSTTVFEDKDLSPGTKYIYSLRAFNNSGEGKPLNYTVTTQTAPIPTTAITTNNGTHEMGLKWEPVKGAAVYEVRNQVTGETQTVTEPLVQLVNLESGTAYTLELVVLNEDGQRSEAVQIEVLTKPLSPQTVAVSDITDKSVVLDLTGSSTVGASELIILRDGIEIGRIQAGTSSYEDYGLTPGEKYTYTIRTSNASGESESGFDVGVQTLPATTLDPVLPQKVEETESVLFWQKVQGAEGYIIRIGDQVITTIDDREKTEFKLTHLASAASYTDVQIVPYNAAGEGSPIVVSPFYTKPHVESVEMKLSPETTQASLMWEFPYSNEIFVLLVDGIEMHRGKQKELVLDQLHAGTKYIVELYTENEQGDASPKLSYDLLTKPDTLLEVGYRSTKESIRLLFDQSHVLGADQFIIERDGEEISRVAADTLFYEDQNLEPGTDYSYAIRTSNESGISEAAYQLNAVTLPGNPTTQPIVQDRTQHGADVLWDIIPGASGYRIYHEDELLTTTTETSVHLSGLNTAERYSSFTIIPYNEAGDGSQIIVPEFDTLPSDKFSVSAAARGTSDILLRWNLDSRNETIVVEYNGRELYRGKERSYTWTGLTGGQHYEVHVWTENEAGEQSERQIVSATTVSYPSSNVGETSASGMSSDKSANTAPIVIETDYENNHEQDNQSPLLIKKEPKFLDIDRTFNKEQITLLAEQNIIQGVSETRFEPRRPITRAEFTALIVRLLKLDTSAHYDHAFQDVNEEDWFAPEIEAAIRHDMVHGMGNGKFAPHALVTREQASKIFANVVRSLNSESIAEAISGRNAFTDQVNVSHWATEEVKELAGLYLLTGYEDGSFRPLQHLNRAEAAALIYRLQKLLSTLEMNGFLT
ncbi:hypothetical protein ASD24_04650 [Paenibacillus sp. Root52]|uniref:fibronectin type III domain-containing protein n=1 Tax=Paenibacillus sp. Root52 TaxID=1736552 RepID=UPI0006FA671A|nr:fibronectin type III domain-containing protein [Paenibacillus sp. Root52]KQY94836.1 hypothetical protein ASD24_04650 [Paenibacillus sp. Root52]